jgi:hypothetical protein
MNARYTLSRNHDDHLRVVFRGAAPMHFGTRLRHPTLLWAHRTTRRAVATLRDDLQELFAAEGFVQTPGAFDAHLDRLVLPRLLRRADLRAATTMAPTVMTHLAAACTRVLARDIRGALVDVGAWKGGASMILKAVDDLKGGGRRLVVYDAFGAAPVREAGPDRLLARARARADALLGAPDTASVAEVQEKFRRFHIGLEHVAFFQGDAPSTALPADAVGDIALLRIGYDDHAATDDALRTLLPRVQPGGTVLVDAYGLEAFGARAAVDAHHAALGGTLTRVGHAASWRLPA